MRKEPLSIILALIVVVLLSIHTVYAQSTAFTYQGSLQSGGTPANGNHDFEFALYDSVSGGLQIGSVQTRNAVLVSSGSFTVQLDFGNQFPGASRYLEIRVRTSGQPGITVLSPRQRLDSSPYSVKSLTADTATTATNATQLGGVAANQFVLTTDPRMSDPRAPTPGSANYVQNTVTTQPASNFNVSGNGTVGGTLTGSVVRANTQFNISNTRILSYDFLLSNLYIGSNSGNGTMTGTANTFIGTNAGSDNTTGFSQTFVGAFAGGSNTTGDENSFFGYASGGANTTGDDNAFFGRSSGHNNTSGSNNSFFGYAAGNFNTTAGSNSFFGHRAGYNNTGGGNSFFGAGSGQANTTGLTNSFYGASSGQANTTGQNNAFFGANAGAANTTALGNAFFGANAGAANTTAMGNSFFGASAGLVNTGANNSFFGTVAGAANTSGFANSFFGYWAGHDNTTGDNNTFAGRSAGELNTTGNSNTFIGHNAGIGNTTGSNNTVLGSGANVNTSTAISYATAIGAGAVVNDNNVIVLGRSMGQERVHIPGFLTLGSFGIGNDDLCSNFTGVIGLCTSSNRYQDDVEIFTGGLDVVRRLRPISFKWKEGGAPDVGFSAEDINEIEPRLVTRRKGQIEGVRYSQMTTVLVNAIKEQQAEIESQRKTIDSQQRQIDAMKAALCKLDPSAGLCN